MKNLALTHDICHSLVPESLVQSMAVNIDMAPFQDGYVFLGLWRNDVGIFSSSNASQYIDQFYFLHNGIRYYVITR